MKKGNKKKILSVVIVVSILLISISFVSAGFWNKITGRVVQNMSITVLGLSPVTVNYISNPGSPTPVTPILSTYLPVVFEVHVLDSDGFGDINTSSVWINVSYNGVDRINNSCSYHGNIINLNTANFTCTVNMWYWDPPKDWNVTVKANDKGNLTEQINNTGILSYGGMNSLEIYPVVLNWPSVSPAGSNNIIPLNGPILINNTGNYDNTVEIKAFDLLDEQTQTNSLSSKNFSIDIDGDACSGGTQLANNSFMPVTGSDSNPGNLSVGDGRGQEVFSYCIPVFPTLPSRTYSTKYGGSWELRVTPY
jgi:hypothetical protein